MVLFDNMKPETRNQFSPLCCRRPSSRCSLDVSHNTCKVEEHDIDETPTRLFVHRKGATKAFGPGHPDIPPALRVEGQPVLIGETMGTASYVLVGTKESMSLTFGSACHGGRSLSRHQALRQWYGREVW